MTLFFLLRRVPFTNVYIIPVQDFQCTLLILKKLYQKYEWYVPLIFIKWGGVKNAE